MPQLSQDIFTIDYVSGICVVTIGIAELQTQMSEELVTRLLALLKEGKSTRFLLDLETVRYMESTCLGALITFYKALVRVDGKIALANTSENVRFLFAVTKLDKVFPLRRDVSEALQFLGQST